MNARTLKIVAAAAVVVLIGAGAFAWNALFGGPEPAAVALSSDTSGTSSPGLGGASGSGTSDGSFDGDWTIDTQSGSFSDFTSTFAGYRMKEELGGIGANTAVGRTPNVDGSLTVDGTSITAMQVTVDMTTLSSDDHRRDMSIHERGLETDRFPTATFELTQPIDVGSVPGEGKELNLDATGNLTLHGVTKEVTVPIKAQWTGSRIEAVASFTVALADYDITPPVGFLVLSLADHGQVELHLLFEKA